MYIRKNIIFLQPQAKIIMKIQVLLSSYNGHQYLEQQLESIFRQKDVEVEVLVRDDGSTDDTVSILRKWASGHALRFYQGNNIGAARSFFDLLKHSQGADFYAFSDEDDVWLPDKLFVAAKTIVRQSAKGQPALYFSDNNLVDRDCHFIRRSIGHPLNITKGNGLIESFAAGCTMVFNPELRDIACHHIPDEDIYHDRWVFLTALYFGKVIYDDTPHMNYRQHGGNLVGTKTEEEKGQSASRIMAKGDFSVSRTARLFLKYYNGELGEEDRKTISNCANYEHNLGSRLRLAFGKDYRLAYGSWKRRLYWRIRILLKKI